MLDVLVLTTEPIKHDRRVRAQIAELEARGLSVDAVEIPVTAAPRIDVRVVVRAFACVLRTFCRAFAGLPQLYRFCHEYRLGEYPTTRIPLFGCFARDVWNPLVNGIMHERRVARERKHALIIANDLQALIYAMGCTRNTTPIIYDSHEFNLHRRRKNAWIRIFWIYAFESCGVLRSSLTIVVGEGVRDALAKLYGNIPLEVMPNAFYVRSGVVQDSIPTLQHGVHLVYVGACVSGRSLDLLLELLGMNVGITASLFIIGKVGAEYEGRLSSPNLRAYYGQDYAGRLCEVVSEHPCVFSWCVIEDVCLSYRLASPNKYYQSIALGIPVLVNSDQWLSGVVERDGNGLVIPAELTRKPAQLARWMVQRAVDGEYPCIRSKAQEMQGQYRTYPEYFASIAKGFHCRVSIKNGG